MRLGTLCTHGVLAAVLGFAFVRTALAVVVYSDTFTRGGSGMLAGSVPTTTTNANTWTVNGTFNTNGSNVTAYPNGAGYGNGFLAVNGASGVVLDGTVNFTLSVDVISNAITSDTQGAFIGIFLANTLNATTPADQGGGNTGDLFNSTGSNAGNYYAQMGLLSNGQLNDLTGSAFVNAHFGLNAVATLQLSYNAFAGTLAYIYNGVTQDTLTGVTPAKIAALTYVGIGSGYNSYQAGTLDNLSLNVAYPAPEPSTYAAVLGGLGGLGLVLRRRALRG